MCNTQITGGCQICCYASRHSLSLTLLLALPCLLVRIISVPRAMPADVLLIVQHFEGYDPEGFSMWLCDYKYNDENTVNYVVMNKVSVWHALKACAESTFHLCPLQIPPRGHVIPCISCKKYHLRRPYAYLGSCMSLIEDRKVYATIFAAEKIDKARKGGRKHACQHACQRAASLHSHPVAFVIRQHGIHAMITIL